MTVAATIITLALNTSGALGIGQTAQAQDNADALAALNDIIKQWNATRAVQVIPGQLALFPDLYTDVPSWTGQENGTALEPLGSPAADVPASRG